MPRGEIAMPRLDFVVGLVHERNFQGVQAPVEFQILRREPQKIGNGRRGARFAQTFVHVISVVKKSSSGSIGELRKDIFLRQLRGRPVQGLITGDLRRIYVGVADISHIRRVQSPRIDGVNHDIRLGRAINQFAGLQGQLRKQKESRRDEHHDSLSRHHGKPAHDVIHVPVSIFRGAVLSLEHHPSHRLRHRLGRSSLCFVALERALHRVFRCHGQSLWILLILD